MKNKRVLKRKLRGREDRFYKMMPKPQRPKEDIPWELTPDELELIEEPDEKEDQA